MRRREFLLAAPALAAAKPSAISFRESEGAVDVLAGGKPLTTFHYAPRWDKPFLHPLRGANGTIVSRGWPVDPQPSETEDHAWHRGLWWGHGDINGHDFWREQGRTKTSILVLTGKPVVRPMAGILEAKMEMRIPSGQVIGTVEQVYTFQRDDSEVWINATITVAADHGEPLKFGDTDDGGLGIRLSEPFREDKGAALRNSEGQRGTRNIWGKPARWIDYAATAGADPLSVAMLDHPSNMRHPTRWHARGYSLASANPFALAAFTRDRTKDGSYTLPAKGRLRLRYAVVIHRAADVEDLYRRYALPKTLK